MWGLAGGLRLTHSLVLQSWEYFVSASFSPLTWVRLEARALQRNRLADPSATSLVFGALHLEGDWIWVRPFVSAGWFLRRHRVGENSVVPVIVSSSFTEHNFALAIGTGIVFSSAWELRGQLATIDTVDVLYLNNPYVEARLLYTPPGNWRAAAYLRYQSLLGFGRVEAWVGGMQVERVLGL